MVLRRKKKQKGNGKEDKHVEVASKKRKEEKKKKVKQEKKKKTKQDKPKDIDTNPSSTESEQKEEKKLKEDSAKFDIEELIRYCNMVFHLFFYSSHTYIQYSRAKDKDDDDDDDNDDDDDDDNEEEEEKKKKSVSYIQMVCIVGMWLKS